jgi:uncharacterized protein (UPF0276 family)
MAALEGTNAGRPGLALAVTYEGDDPRLLESMVSLVDLIEITPDAIARSDGGRYHLRAEVLDEYARVLPRIELIAHGVGLSIGSFDHWNDDYLRLLDELFARFDLKWHSEHLACSMVEGESIGTMFCMPRTEEALDLVCKRVRLIQERYPIPFLLEHIIQLLPDAPAEYTPAGFLNAITSRTGCGLILDAYNLECDVHNQGLDVGKFLDELDHTTVCELHLAGGVEHGGFQLDVHSCITRDTTLTLALDIIKRAPKLRAITFEFLKSAVGVLGHDAICDELARIRQTVIRQAVLQ